MNLVLGEGLGDTVEGDSAAEAMELFDGSVAVAVGVSPADECAIHPLDVVRFTP